MTLVKKYLSEKPVDKLEETNPELSQYSSVSNLTNLWTAKRLSQRKNRQKLTKRHRFPVSLLSLKAADFWNALMPLRANCSCSSVSISDKCSRLSFGVSFSDATVGSNSDSSLPLIEETAVQKSLGDTLEHTHLAFELLIARMVRLLDILNETSDSSLSHIYSGSDLKTFQKLKKSAEMIARGSCNRFLSTTSLSNNSSNHWSVRRSGKKWGSFSEFEIADQKRQILRLSERGFFSRTSLVPKSLRSNKTALTKEELVYLLEYKKSLLSDYFRSKVDSTDLKKSPNSSERKSFIYGTQSDSRLQEHSLLQFVEFIRTRKKEDGENLLKENFRSLGSQKSNTNLLSEPLNNEDCHSISTPKRRVTFSDPLPKKTISLLNCCSSDDEDGILSAQSFTTAIANDFEIPNEENVPSDPLLDSESASPSVSSVALKSCFANLSLKSLSTKARDPDIDLILIKSATEQIVCETKNITDEIPDSAQSEQVGEIESPKNTPRYDISDVDMGKKEFEKNVDAVSMMTVEKLQPNENEGLVNKTSSSVPLVINSVEKLSKSGEDVEMIEGEKPEPEFLVKEILDCGTTHVPLLNDVGPNVIMEVDGPARQVTFEDCSPQRNLEKCLKRNISPIEIRENCTSLDDDHRTLNRKLEHRLIRKKIRFSDIQQSEMPLQCNEQKLNRIFCKEENISEADTNSRPSSSSGKTVTFQDCCKTVSDQSIISNQKELGSLLQSDDELISSSKSKGRFELSWKGCWDQQSATSSVQIEEQLEANPKESNTTKVTSASVMLIPIETYEAERDLSSNNHELSSGISGSQTSYYTTMEDEIQLANNDSSRCKAACPSSNPRLSYIPSFTEIAASLEKDEVIPWLPRSEEDSSKSCKSVSILNGGFESNPDTLKLPNRMNFQKGLTNVYKSIRYPQIWRSEVRRDAKALSKSDWYIRHGSDKYPWKASDMKSDWLIRKLEELQSSPETDYESDYYGGSEVESDCECERDLSLIKRSFSNLDTRSKNRKKFSVKRSRLRQDLFLDKVWPSKKITFNECRCHKNPPRNKHGLRLREHDLRHKVLPESAQLSNQNFFSHLRARLILDSETDDSDFAPSIQPDFYYDFNRKDEHVNKMKCRRFVKSLKSIRSEEDRQFSSSRFLRVNFKKSFRPASVQSARSTRTVGTNVSEKQNCNMMDVCIDTYDLCPCKAIGTTNTASNSEYLNKTSSCQTDLSFGSVNSFQDTNDITKASSILRDRDTPLGPNFQISRSNGQRMSSALAGLSTQINNASNNLAKLRFSEKKTEPEKVELVPTLKGDNFGTTPLIKSTPSIIFHFSPAVKTFDNVKSCAEKSSDVLKDPNSHTAEYSSCPICHARKKPTGRYALPSCIVKGVGPDPKTNEKDPWNRVMEQAKAQHRYERRNTSTCLEMRQIACSAHVSTHFKSLERKQANYLTSDQSQKEEIRVQLVQVKNNSTQAAVCDLKYSGVIGKVTSPRRKDEQFALAPASALCSSTSSDFPMLSFPRTRSQKRTKKPKAVPNTSNRLLYIISESAELMNQMPTKSPVVNFFSQKTRRKRD